MSDVRSWTHPPIWLIGAGALGALGPLPGLNLGAHLLAAIEVQRVRFELVLSMLSGRVNSDVVPSRGATFELYRAASRVCWRMIGGESFALGPCGSLEFGLLSGKGFGVSRYYTERALWVAGTAGAMAEFRLAQSSFLLLSAEMALPLSNDEFTLAGETLLELGVFGTTAISLVARWH